MTDLPPEELAEIEHKVARFRKVVTDAACKRWEWHKAHPPLPDLKPRNEAIYLARQTGRTYRNIGQQYGLSVERVRGIVASIDRHKRYARQEK